MKLDELYGRVSESIASLALTRIRPGFSPLRFALYDDEACFFAGTYIEKPDAFCANTSISYHGETIAMEGRGRAGYFRFDREDRP